jgi:hypothetical protein
MLMNLAALAVGGFGVVNYTLLLHVIALSRARPYRLEMMLWV